MSRPHRISAAGLTIRDGAVLLVRYRDAAGGTFLVGPGGGLGEDENVVQAIVRETMEETDVRVQPRRVVFIEDLICAGFKMIKVWMICDYVEGEVRPTTGAEMEGIIEASWFTRDQLADEVVYPSPFLRNDWDRLRSESWEVECLPVVRADF